MAEIVPPKRPLRTILLCLAIVIGALLVFRLGYLSGLSQAARVSTKPIAAAQQLSTIRLALEMFYADAKRFPTPAEGLAVLRTPMFRGPYITRDVPLLDPWGRPIIYDYSGAAGDVPTLRSYGQDGVPGGSNEDADLTARPVVNVINTFPASATAATAAGPVQQPGRPSE